MPTALAVAVMAGAMLAGCVTGPGPAVSPTPTSPASDSPSPGPAATSTPSTAPTPALDEDDRANIRDAITSGNTAALEGYFSDPVRVIFMASECCFDVTPAAAVEAMGQLSTATPPWDFALAEETLEFWRSNQYYGYLFTGDDISGRAADGTVVNVGIVGDRITTVLIGFEEGFTH